MKTRILTAAIGVPLLFILVLLAPEEVAAVVFGLMLSIAVYELLYRTRLIRRPRMVIYSSIAACTIAGLYTLRESKYPTTTSFTMVKSNVSLQRLINANVSS